MARKKQDIRLVVKAEVEKALSNLKKTDQELDNLSNTAGKGIPKFTNFGTAVKGFIAALAIRELAQGVLELGKLGAEARNVEKAFSQLDNSNDLLETMRKNVRGSVSDLELMRAAITGLDLGATNEQMEVFSKFARFEAVRKGGDELQTLQNILGGVLRGSTELLDNFGLSLTQVNREIENLAKASGKSATKLSAVERRTLMVQAAMNLMNQRLESAGESALESADHSANAAAAWENLQVAVGKLVDQPVDDFFNVAAGAMNFAADAINNLEKQFISFQLSVLNRIDPTFQKLLTGLDEHSKKMIEADKGVQQYMDIWVQANTQLAKAKESLQLVNNVYGQQSQQAKDASDKVQKNAKLAHDSYLLLQQRVVELRKELGKPLDIGGTGGETIVDPAAMKKAQAQAKRMAEEYENAQRLIQESTDRTSKKIIQDAQDVINKYRELKERNVELDREQIEMVKQISETSIAEAIAVSEYLIENWEFTEEEKKKLLELRKDWIQEAADEEIRQAERAAFAIKDIMSGPMQRMVEDLLQGTSKAKDIWSDFIDYLMSELRRFIASQLVATFFQFFLNLISGPAGAANVGALLLSPSAPTGTKKIATIPLNPISSDRMSLPKLSTGLPVPSFMQPGTISNITTDNSQKIDMGNFQVVMNGPVYGEDATLLNAVKKLQQEHQHRLGRHLNKPIL